MTVYIDDPRYGWDDWIKRRGADPKNALTAAGVEEERAMLVALEFDESKHPRDWHGRFGVGAHDQGPPAQTAELLANLDKQFGITPKDLENQARSILDRATPEDVAYGTGWYTKAGQQIQDRIVAKYGIDTTTANAIVAVQSANNLWERNGKTEETSMPNLATAARTVAILQADPTVHFDDAFAARWGSDHVNRLPITPEVFDQMKAQYPDGAKLSQLEPLMAARFMSDDVHAGIGANPPWESIAKSVQLFRGESPETVISGSKITSFFNNFQDPHGPDVTVDRWMVRGLLPDSAIQQWGALHPNTQAAKAGDVDPNILSAPDPTTKARAAAGYDPTVTTYSLFADAVRTVATERGLHPSDAQAIIWSTQVRPH